MNGYLLGNKKRGVYRIYNLKTDKTYLKAAEDMAKAEAEDRFKLDLGMHSNRALQEDYSATGLELFVFETYREAEEGDDLEKLLTKCIDEAKERKLELY